MRRSVLTAVGLAALLISALAAAPAPMQPVPTLAATACLSPADVTTIRARWTAVTDGAGQPPAGYHYTIRRGSTVLATDTVATLEAHYASPCPAWGDSAVYTATVRAIASWGEAGTVGTSPVLVLRTSRPAPPGAPVVTLDTVALVTPAPAPAPVPPSPPPAPPSPPPAPPPPSGAAFEQQWNYATTQAMTAAAMGTPACPVSLEAEAGIPTSTTGKYARTRYPGNGSEGNCNLDYRLNVGNAREIWLEAWIRFDAAWTGTSDDKTLFLFSNAQGNRRWEIHYASSTRAFGGASNMAWEFTNDYPDFSNALNPRTVWDGQWHRHRLHLKMGSGDGIFEWWFDDHAIITRTQASRGWVSKTGANINTGNQAADFFHSIRLGANADPRGSGVRDWGPIRVYTSNPGW